jgi:hypothetical protein
VPDRKTSAPDRLVALATEHFTLHTTTGGDPYAVARNGSTTRRSFTGKGSLRSALAKLFNDAEGRVPPPTALTSALGVLSEQARQAGPDPADALVADVAPELLKQEPSKSVATQLVQLAEQRYSLSCTPDGEPYAIPLDGPPIVRQLRGGRQSLRAELASAYYQATGSAASQSALADACTVIEGKAQREEPIELYLRVAEHEDRVILDLGDATGRAVVVDTLGWQVIGAPPVRFRRTALTSALPTPVGGYGFTGLWAALNVAEKYRPLVLAVLVSALMPAMPHVVVLLTGEQGTGKSTATGRLASILDPSPAQLRKAPRDVEAWTTAAAGSWVVALDNLSGVPDWLSDALCRASTGDGDVRRRLYTDGDLHVIAFRRVPVINGIDLGALRGDLADRLVHLALDRIPDDKRRRDEEMTAQWREAHPEVLGALLDLAVQVLAVLPSITLDRSPRMADFARVLAAVDKVNGTDGLATYLGLRAELAEDAATSDPVLVALAQKVTKPFRGTSAELLNLITPCDEEGRVLVGNRLPKDWPSSARSLTATLTRQAPTLRQLGWLVVKLDRGTAHAKVLRWRLEPPSESKQDHDPDDAVIADDDPDGQRRSAKPAAHAAFAAQGEFPQVNGYEPGAANGAANVRQTGSVAAPAASAANGQTLPRDAARFAAPAEPGLTRGNEDHAANAANAASSAHPLGSGEVLAPPCCGCGGGPPFIDGAPNLCDTCLDAYVRVCRRCQQPTQGPLIGGLCHSCAYPAGGYDDAEDDYEQEPAS